MMEKLCRAYQAEVRSVDGEERTVTSTVNTASVDRYKTVISPEGIDLLAYRKNPVVLWEHGKDPTRGSKPIGKNLWIRQVGPTLQAKTVFWDDEYSRSIFEMYKEGMLSGWSINVLPDPNSSSPPTKEEMRARPELSECRMVYRKGELAEYSAVAVPGNSETLTILEQRGIWVPEELRSSKAVVEEKEEEEEGESAAEEEKEQEEDGEEAEEVEENEGEDEEETVGRKKVQPKDKARALRYIRKKGSKWVVYSRKGKVLGAHSSKADAVAQLGAIEASKSRRQKGRRIELDSGVYRVLNDSDVVLSTQDYDVAVECLESMGERWRSFEEIHSSLLQAIRREHAQIRSDILALLDLSLSGRV